MKRALMIIGALFTAALVAAALYVESDAFEQALRPKVLGPLQEVLGPRAVIGRIRMTLVPLVLEVRDVTVPAETAGDGIAVRKVRVYINPFPLLYRTLSISSVTVLEPRIVTQRGRDGRTEAEALLRDVLNNLSRMKRGGPPDLAVRLGAVSVRSGRITVTDAPSSVRADISRIDIGAVFGATAAQGSVRVSGAECVLSLPSGSSVRADFRAAGSYEGNALSLQSLDIASPSLRISASGKMVAAADGILDVRLNAKLGRGLLGMVKGVVGRAAGMDVPLVEASVRLAGTLSDPVAEGALDVRDAGFSGTMVRKAALKAAYRRGSFTLSGEDWVLERGRRRFVIRHLEGEGNYRDGAFQLVRSGIAADHLAAQASGSYDLKKGMLFSVSADAGYDNTLIAFLIGEDAAGAAAIKGMVSGRTTEPVFDGTLTAGPLKVRGVPFESASGLVRYQGRKLTLSEVALKQADSRYLFDGSMDLSGPAPWFEAKLDVVRSDVVSVVELFYKRIPLVMTASGEMTFSGTGSQFTGAARLDLGAGSAYGESFDRGTITAELTSSRIAFPRVVLEKSGGQVTGRGWIGFDGSYFANIDSRGVDLSRVDHLKALDLGGPFSLNIHSSGSFSRPTVSARADSPSLAVHGVEVGVAACALSLGDGRLQVSASARHEQKGRFDLSGQMELGRAYPWSLRAAFSVPDLDMTTYSASSDLPARMLLAAEGSAAVAGRGLERRALQGMLRLPRAELTIGDYRIENDGEIGVAVEKGAFAVRRLALKGIGTRLAVTGEADPAGEVAIDATGDINLSLARLLSRELEYGDGSAALQLAVRQTWSDPSFEGRITVRDGMLKVREIPQKFTALGGAVVFDRERVSTEGLSAEFGGGKVTLIGSVQLERYAPSDFSVRAVIDNVSLRHPPGMNASIGGTLYYEGDRSSQMITGDLAILRMRYEQRVDWKSMLVDVTQGIVRRKKSDPGKIGDIQLNVRLSGKDNIVLESNLGKMAVKADLVFRGLVKQPQVLGRLESREGEVFFRRNVFRVTYASADFVSIDRINPVIDVKAETRVRDYRIYLSVSGYADRSVVTLLSDPPLSDSDILSMLALGRKGEELKGRESNVGVGEATSFATGKFQDLLETRARSLTGLDRFQVDPYLNKSDAAVPRVTVGKEVVQDRLIMTYSSNVGGTAPEQMFRLEYLLNRNVSLVGARDETGNLGADLKFRFEFR